MQAEVNFIFVDMKKAHLNAKCEEEEWSRVARTFEKEDIEEKFPHSTQRVWRQKRSLSQRQDGAVIVAKLWVNGRASEDRVKRADEVRAHCENCYDDQIETPEVQARIRD